MDLPHGCDDNLYKRGIETGQPSGGNKRCVLSPLPAGATQQSGVEFAKRKAEFDRKSLPLRQRIQDQQLKIQKAGGAGELETAGNGG